MSGLTAIWAWLQGVDPRIWQAVIAGLFVAVGWIVNGRQNRRRSSRMRKERLRDVHRALFAEIGANLQTLGSAEMLRAQSGLVVQRMRDEANRGRSYIPFVVRDRKDQVYASIIDEIHILPRTTIDAVVAYYAQLQVMGDVTEDLRGKTFAQLPVERQVRLYEDLTEMKVQAFAFGNHALRMIDIYAKKGKEEAEKFEQELREQTAEAEAKRLEVQRVAASEREVNTLQDADRSGP
ncbi:hypothetical protein AAD018_004885 [Aestuariibius insulae]|uniref:hypothetical protein n=1 Tax=Aestuariibius insulae TaxID=2058287 RepID=UPI00345E07FA